MSREAYKSIITELTQKMPENQQAFVKLLRKKSKEFKINLPRKAQILKVYNEMLANGELEKSKDIENILRKRSIRTISGVAPLTVMTAPLSCPSDCLYCPKEENMPKSYLSNQPAAMRAVLSDFDPHKQTTCRLRALKNNGHNTEKIEIIINGGTWSAHPRAYQTWYIKNIFHACNHYNHESSDEDGMAPSKKSASIIAKKLLNRHQISQNLYSSDDSEIIPKLQEEQKINETTENRIIGITLETRPDHITPEEIARMRMLGATKVEIGVQTLYPEVVELNRREQNLDEVIRATKLLKDAGFKIAYHMMPGMYGSTPEKDIAMMKEIFENENFKPDFLKIYPCVVIKESDLYEVMKRGDYKPYPFEVLVDTLAKIKRDIPRYTRIARLQREWVDPAGGCGVTNLREYVDKEMEERNWKCQCIRSREAKQVEVKPDEAILNVTEIDASGTQEYFLSFDSKDEQHLYAFLRLRMISNNSEIHTFIPELKDAAIVRELHTYGRVIPIKGDNDEKAVQHLGFGKRLMEKAEELAKKNGAKKMAVISGIGVREYYAKLGYKLEGTYMVKNLD